jgi:hypothetical protein
VNGAQPALVAALPFGFTHAICAHTPARAPGAIAATITSTTAVSATFAPQALAANLTVVSLRRRPLSRRG